MKQLDERVEVVQEDLPQFQSLGDVWPIVDIIRNVQSPLCQQQGFWRGWGLFLKLGTLIVFINSRIIFIVKLSSEYQHRLAMWKSRAVGDGTDLAAQRIPYCTASAVSANASIETAPYHGKGNVLTDEGRRLVTCPQI